MFIQNFVIFITVLWTVHGAPSDLKEHEDNFRTAKSKEILQYLNQSIDPCDNFYNFACGNYHRFQKPIDYELLINSLYLSNREYDATVLKLLTTDDANETDSDRNMKLFYQSCLSFDHKAVTVKYQLKDIIGEFGKMPALEGDKWNDGDNFDWLKSIGEISHIYGFNIIMKYSIIADVLNTTVPRLALMAPNLELGNPKIYVEDAYKSNRQGYIRTIAEFLKFLGLSKDVANKTANDIAKFEISLAHGMLGIEEKVEQDDENESEEDEDEVEEEDEGSEQNESLEEVEEISLKDDTTLFSTDGDAYFQQWLRISLGSFIPSEMYIFDRIYFENLNEIVNKTPKAVLANYIYYNLARNFVVYYSTKPKLREAQCLLRLNKHFYRNLSNMVYRKLHTDDTEQGVNSVWQHIKSTFEKNIKFSANLNWMSEETRKAALEKIKAVTINILSYNQHNFTKDFVATKFEKDDLIANLQASFALKATYTRSKLTQDYVSDMDTSMGASYINKHNRIQVPVKYLLPNHYWSASNPNAVNFGALGFTLGHEMIHALDNANRKFDKTGALANWWDDESAAHFLDGKQCFRDQYKQYIYKGRPLTDKEVQDEDIADSSGIRLAYEAYRDWYENNHSTKLEKLETLPGLNYNNKQLFFIAFAQEWCTVTIPTHSVEATDVHTTEEFRIIGSLSNLEDFSKAFSCPSGSVMNPVKKCILY